MKANKKKMKNLYGHMCSDLLENHTNEGKKLEKFKL